MERLIEHFAGIADNEGATVETGGLGDDRRAADGSVRDGLSLLDQAIAHGAGRVSEEQVRDMLGLADRARVFDLFDAVMSGNIGSALDQMAEQYALGADPVMILGDMLELTHWLTRLKLAPETEFGPAVSETERVRGGTMAKGLSMATLTRSWRCCSKASAKPVRRRRPFRPPRWFWCVLPMPPNCRARSTHWKRCATVRLHPARAAAAVVAVPANNPPAVLPRRWYKRR